MRVLDEFGVERILLARHVAFRAGVLGVLEISCEEGEIGYVLVLGIDYVHWAR